MSFGRRTNFNSRPRGEKRGRRMEEDTDREDGWRNRDPDSDSEEDPRPEGTRDRLPFPPARKTEIVSDTQVGRVKVAAESDEDILAGIRVVVLTEITGEEAIKTASPDEQR